MVSPIFFYRIGHRFHMLGWKFLAELMERVCFLICHADIAMDCVIGKNVIFGHWGLGVVINGVVEIEDNVIIYHNVTIGRSRKIVDDNPDQLQRIVIGANSLIGTGATILGKSGELRIGRNCEIGAGAVVLESIPDNSMAIGIPAIYSPSKSNYPRVK
jgi:serine O-acetyltransferase